MESKTEGIMWKSIKILLIEVLETAFCLGPTIKKTNSDYEKVIELKKAKYNKKVQIW